MAIGKMAIEESEKKNRIKKILKEKRVNRRQLNRLVML